MGSQFGWVVAANVMLGINQGLTRSTTVIMKIDLGGETDLTGTAISVIPLETPTLGDRSYLVHDGQVAFVVDPQRDIDRVLALLDEHGVLLTHVFESHIHNDYVTGGLALARRTGAAYLVNAQDRVTFERTGKVWVHCAGGYRASIAASFLAAAGRQLTAIDDEFDNAREAGLLCTPVGLA